MNASRPDISIVVNTFEKPRHLELLLASIALQRGVEGRFEVVVADDGSRDRTAEVVAGFAARQPFRVAWTTEPHDGFRLARVRNRGAALARGETLLFVDGDSILPADHVAAHLERRRPGWAQLGDVLRLPEEACRDLQPGSIGTFDPAALAPTVEIRRLARRHRRAGWYGWIGHPTKPRLAGGNFAVWSGDYRRVNGSDERFRGWGQEDDDLGLRLRAAGVRLESILDRTRAYHVWHPVDPSATPRWRDGVNVPYFERRGRLCRCRQGLATRGPGDVLWRLPDEPARTPLGAMLLEQLGAAPRAAPGTPCEIEVAVWPGSARFQGAAECRLLLVDAAHSPRLPGGLRRAADRSETLHADDCEGLAAALAAAG